MRLIFAWCLLLAGGVLVLLWTIAPIVTAAALVWMACHR